LKYASNAQPDILETKEGVLHMESRTYYYARVSSREQNLDRQLAAFTAMGASERDIITDKESGKDLNRAGYTALKTAMLRRGDTLVVKSLDRLSRSKTDIKNELQYFRDNGIRLKVLDLPTTMVDYPEGQEWVLDMVNNILVEVLASIAQQERETIHKRQAEGIAAAKARGKALGRPVIQKPDNWTEVVEQWHRGQITAKKAMELTGVKRTTFYKLVGEGTNNRLES
jgi:DNA invertase Pin-like site-specific DNA recombinase